MSIFHNICLNIFLLIFMLIIKCKSTEAKIMQNTVWTYFPSCKYIKHHYLELRANPQTKMYKKMEAILGVYGRNKIVPS